MSQEHKPIPVDLYEAAVRHTRAVVAGVKSEQLNNPTPCSEWNVQALLNHLVEGIGFASGILLGLGPQPAPTAGSTLETYDAGTAKVLEIARTAGTLEKRVSSPIGEMAGGEFLATVFMDTLIHGWDLAKATGQDTRLEPTLATICYSVAVPIAEPGRQGGAFGPEVEVSRDANPQDKILGLTGRNP